MFRKVSFEFSNKSLISIASVVIVMVFSYEACFSLLYRIFSDDFHAQNQEWIDIILDWFLLIFHQVKHIFDRLLQRVVVMVNSECDVCEKWIIDRSCVQPNHSGEMFRPIRL